METTEHPLQPTTTRAAASPVLLRAEGLRKSFGGQVVLDGVELDLRRGEVVLLRGENGSGKTTLLNILTGNMEPDAGTISYHADDTPRTYVFPRRWWQDLNPFDHFTPEFVAREGVGRTWQDVRLFNAQTLRDNVAVAEPGHPGENPALALLAPHYANRREAVLNREADAMLARLGLAGRETSSADRVSLGQGKRVAIARALAAGARILFLDEPLAGLDGRGVADVLGLLRALARDHAVTMVIIEHVFNLVHLQDLATSDWLLVNGKIDRSERRGSRPSTAVGGHARSDSRSTFLRFIAADAIVRDESLPGGARLTRVRAPEVSVANGRPVLMVQGLTVRRGHRLIDWASSGGDAGLSLAVSRGEVVFLQAPNGWGKTTLLDCIAGFLSSETGDVLLDGTSLTHEKAWARARAGVRCINATRNVFVGITGSEMLRLSRTRPGALTARIPLERDVSEYSGGQRQQLALAASQGALPPKIYVFDEPFSMLDDDAIDHFAPLFAPDPRYGVLVLLPLTVETT